MKSTGSYIQHARMNQGMNQEKFARLLGVSRQTLSRIERGVDTLGKETQLTDSMLAKVAGLLSLDLGELYALEGRELDWELSNTRSIGASVGGIDLTGLSLHQIDLIAGIVEELKKGADLDKNPE